MSNIKQVLKDLLAASVDSLGLSPEEREVLTKYKGMAREMMDNHPELAIMAIELAKAEKKLEL